MRRPKIGLYLMTAEWFAQIGATQGSFSQLLPRLREDAARMEQALGAELEVVNPGILATRAQADAAVEILAREKVDAVIACQITWGEDRLLLHLLDEMPQVPLLLWCYTPARRLPETIDMGSLFRLSGPVGALQASGPLKRLGRRFGFAFGSYENGEAIRKITAFARAAEAARGLRRVTIGLLPYRCDQMSGTYVDEFRLRTELGPELKYISTFDYKTCCDQVSSARVEQFARDLRASYPIAPAVSERGLNQAARVSLGLADVVMKYGLDALAIEDVGEDLHRVVGVRPCLSAPELFQRAVVSMETDVSAAVGMWLLRELSGGAPMFTEILTYDEAENCLLMGHAGMHDTRLVESRDQVLIEPDGEYLESEPDSAWMRFRAKGGAVTMLNVFCDVERFKFVISRGEALSGPVKLLGTPHIYVRIAPPLAEFFEKSIRSGMTQHWLVVHADVVEELLALAGILGLDTLVI